MCVWMRWFDWVRSRPYKTVGTRDRGYDLSTTPCAVERYYETAQIKKFVSSITG